MKSVYKGTWRPLWKEVAWISSLADTVPDLQTRKANGLAEYSSPQVLCIWVGFVGSLSLQVGYIRECF